LTVLVVEGQVETAVSLAMLLRQWGHEVRVAFDGHAAVRAVRERLPDVVLLDLGLRGEIDGYAVARRAGEQPGEKKPLLVAMSGRPQDADRTASAATGIDLHLVKPVDLAQLQRLLSRFRAIIL
jgi:CheY-like chemotaxis protein